MELSQTADRFDSKQANGTTRKGTKANHSRPHKNPIFISPKSPLTSQFDQSRNHTRTRKTLESSNFDGNPVKSAVITSRSGAPRATIAKKTQQRNHKRQGKRDETATGERGIHGGRPQSSSALHIALKARTFFRPRDAACRSKSSDSSVPIKIAVTFTLPNQVKERETNTKHGIRTSRLGRRGEGGAREREREKLICRAN